MQPDMALTLYILFIAAAFALERKEKPEVSLGLWVPQIWVTISASRPVYYWLYPEPIVRQGADYLAGNPIDRPILSVLLAIGLIILFRRKVDWPFTFKNNIWIFLLFLYMGASIAWSDFPSVSLKRWVRSIGDLVMVLIVLTERNPIEAIKTLIMRTSFMLLPLSIIFVKFFPHLGVAYTTDGLATMWIGVTTHKNELGVLALICGIFLLWNMMASWRNRKIEYLSVILMVMTFWLLRGSTTSDSKTSLLAFLLSSCMLIFLNLLRSNPRLVGRILLGLALAFVFLNVMTEEFGDMSLYEVIVRSSDRDPTLTGRTDLWKDLIVIASESPLLGRGFGSFWIGNLSHNLWEKFTWLPTQAHNGYIDVFLELGLVGLFLLISAILLAYKSILKVIADDFGYASLRLVFFLMVLVHNFTESSFLRGGSFLWFVFLLFAINPSINKRNGETPGTRQEHAAVLKPRALARGAGLL